MINRLRNLWHNVRTSLWALPLLIVATAIAIAYLALSVTLPGRGALASFLGIGSTSEASQFLSSLLGSMITMATLAVSITMVVLTLAAQQLGPRLIRNFIADKKTQAALGLFLGTVAYLLVVLHAVSGSGAPPSKLAVSGGALLVLLSIVTLLVFVHHVANAIIADNAIARVGAQLDDDIARMLPAPDEDDELEAPDFDRAKAVPVSLEYGGYIQAIDYRSIVAAASESGAVIEVGVRPGHFAVNGSRLAWIQGGKKHQDLAASIRSAVATGHSRTPFQDIEYSIRQLVEIAVRALSPGINDPFTAVAVLDRLAESLAAIMQRAPARSLYADEKGTVRLLVSHSSFGGIVAAAFDMIRQAGAGHPAVLIQMTDNLCQLIAVADDDRKPVLLRYLDLIADAGKAIPQKCDRDSLAERIAHARKGDCLPQAEAPARRKARKS